MGESTRMGIEKVAFSWCGCFFSMAGTRNKLMCKIDIEEPTRITDEVYLGCTQREKRNKQNTRDVEVVAFQQTRVIWCKHDYQSSTMTTSTTPRSNLETNTFSFIVTVRRTPFGTCAKRTKITRAPCRRNPESREEWIPRATIFGDVIWITSLSMKNTSRDYTIDVRELQDLATQWIQSYLCKKHDSTRYDEKFAAILTFRKHAWSYSHRQFLRVLRRCVA